MDLDYWEFNSSRIYSDRSNLIFIEKTDKEAKSGNNSISINIENQRLTVSRLIDYLPGDSLNFSSKFLLITIVYPIKTVLGSELIFG